MATEKDFIGFDEMKKGFSKICDRFPDRADALATSYAKQAGKLLKSRVPVKTGNLKKGIRVDNAKAFKGGTVHVGRVRSTANHAHLVEYGHRNTGGRTRAGRAVMSDEQLRASGVAVYNKVEGKYYLKKTMDEVIARFTAEAEEMLQKLIDEGFA